MTTINQIRSSVIERFMMVLEESNDEHGVALLRLLQLRAREPKVFVTVIGETSTGKTTLINNLIGKPILHTGAQPTTATVTHINETDDDPPRFFAIYADATQEALSEEQFQAYSCNPPKDLLRLQVRTRLPQMSSTRLQIFDTPGFNAVMEEHEEILRSFLPESDIILFVVGYRTGFGQVDQDLLEIVFQNTEEDMTLPILLIINRVPPSINRDDKRIREIVSNAADSLKRPQIVFLVPSTFDPSNQATVAESGGGDTSMQRGLG